MTESRCLPEARLPAEAEIIRLMRRVWRLCQRPEFARKYAELCARAMVAEINACGTVVRDNFWVLIKPKPHLPVIKAAARFAAKLAVDGYIPYRVLLLRAVEEFVEIIRLV
ncbi:MAG: hypothetical protein QW680_12345 [Pyrobaculum sp.]